MFRSTPDRTHEIAAGRPNVASRGISSARQPRPRRGIFGRLFRVTFLVAIPVVPIAYRMHIQPEFRKSVEKTLPGATKLLSRITGVQYETVEIEKEQSDAEGFPPESILNEAKMITKTTEHEDRPQRVEQREVPPHTKLEAETPVDDTKNGTSRTEQLPGAVKNGSVVSELRESDFSAVGSGNMRISSAESKGELSVRRSWKGQNGETDSKESSDTASERLEKYQGSTAIRNGGTVGEEACTLPKVPDSSSEIDALKQQVQDLRTELESRTKWEAVRLQEAVQAQSLHEKRLTATAAAAAAKKYAEEKSKAVAAVRRRVEDEYERMLTEIKRDMEDRIESRVREGTRHREAEMRLSIRSELAAKSKEDANARVEELSKLKAAVKALENEIDLGIEQRKAARIASQISAAAFSMRDVVENTSDFGSDLDIFMLTEIGKLIVGALPSLSAPTMADLKIRFTKVSKEGRRAALIPEDKRGSLWSHILATIVSRIKVGISTVGVYRPSEVPKTAEEKIRLAEQLIAEGNLTDGISVLDSVDGLAGEIMGDWLSEAKRRLAANHAARILQADAIVSQAVLSPSEP